VCCKQETIWEDYGTAFTKNDVIGCGLNSKEGTVFFTKNGKYLGVAFKNVYGRFFAGIGSSSAASVLVNFGQMPFLFDLNGLPETPVRDSEENKGKVAHVAMSFASEGVMLMRYLLQCPNWREPILKFIHSSLNATPPLLRSLFVSQGQGGEAQKPSSSSWLYPAGIDYSSLCHITASLSILGGHVELLRIGGRVKVQMEEYSDANCGTVLEYIPYTPTAIVLLDSELRENREASIHHVSSLIPIQTVAPDSSLISSSFGIIQNLVLFFRSGSVMPSEGINLVSLFVYHYLRSQIMILLNVCSNETSVVSYLLQNGKTHSSSFLFSFSLLLLLLLLLFLISLTPFLFVRLLFLMKNWCPF
jgi:hypothetical protein